MEELRTMDTRAEGGTPDEPLMISRAEFVEKTGALHEGTTWGSYATEAPSGGGRTDWPRDYATD
jgi:hypothetical protein